MVTMQKVGLSILFKFCMITIMWYDYQKVEFRFKIVYGCLDVARYGYRFVMQEVPGSIPRVT